VILDADKIEDAGQLTGISMVLPAGTDPYVYLFLDPGARYNTEYDGDGIYTDHIVTVALTDSWRNDRIKPEVAFSVGVERQDWRAAPEVEFALRDDARLSTGAVIYGGPDDSLFGGFDANDFVQVRFEYSF